MTITMQLGDEPLLKFLKVYQLPRVGDELESGGTVYRVTRVRWMHGFKDDADVTIWVAVVN